MRFNIQKIINVGLMLTVYCAFFVVQLLFNMGAYTTSPHEVAGRVFFSKSKDHPANGDCKTQLPKIFKKKTLLNKRFQPVNLPVVPYAVVAPEPMVLSGMFVNCPPDYLLISSILADSLRGPPALA